MKKILSTLVVFMLCTTMAQAQWWSSKNVKGNGDYTTQARTLKDYDAISVEGSLDVRLTSGEEGALSIQAESNLLEYILTEVKGGQLKISVQDGYNLMESRNMNIKISVPVEDIEAVSLTGSGDIVSTENLDAEEFNVQLTGSGDIALRVAAQKINGRITGSGDIDLSGTADELECKVTGSGDFDASKLKARKVSATVSGSGDLDVYASEELKSRVSGSGDITYRGNPEKQDFRTSGSGSIESH